MAFNTLFSPLTVGRTVLKNRIFSSGHMTVMLRDGQPTDQMVAYHQARAEGGAALIILEAARAHPSGDSGRPALRAYDDACIDGYRRIGDACQPAGARVFAQLTHPGREMAMAADGSRAVAYAPSAVPNERFHVMPRPLSATLIEDIIAGFGAAAGRIARAGLDGVEVVAAHGYLLSQFLNPRLNRRDDAWGGDADRRLAFVREVLAQTRAGLGPGPVLGLRISGDEKEYDALNQSEVGAIAQALAKDGVLDYLHVTAGSSAGLAGSTHIVPPMAYGAAYTAPLAAAIRARVSIPVFVAGRINQPQVAETVLESGQADMVAMTRALIADPKMPLKAEEGLAEDIRACVACNQACIGHMLTGHAISCIQRPETGREREFGHLEPAARPRKVAVVGAGPAGMKAAAVAAARGHRVTLYEAEAQPGGQVALAQALPGRVEFGGVTTNLMRELERTGVELRFGKHVVADDLLGADSVVLATGARPWRPPVEGAEDGHMVDAWEVLRGQANPGGRVVLADGRADWVGLGMAEHLARAGCHVRLAVNGTMAGQNVPQYTRDAALGTLFRLGVEVVTHARLFGLDRDSAWFQHTLTGEAMEFEAVDTVVTALGHAPVTDLEQALSPIGERVHLIGDCLAPRTVEEAVLEGLRVGAAL